MKKYCDVLIIGGGIAGLYTALTLDKSLNVIVLTKDSYTESNSYLAQGGIAAAISPEDKEEYHYQDTINVGGGICNYTAVKTLVNEAKKNIINLSDLGVNFDKDKGKLALTREGGHSKFRILHIGGDATGRGIVTALEKKANKQKNIEIKKSFCLDLLIKDNICIGAVALEDDNICHYYAKAIVLATGGMGMVYGITTNTQVATGDGIAMAHRAGAKIINMEFIQFHPTVFYSKDKQRFLISEALRGEGAILKNINGKRFMELYDNRLELAPRDVVSRAIIDQMQKTKSDFVYLDISHIEKEHIIKRFPNIYVKCLEYGIDITKDMIPVAPAQHYCIGGIKTNLYGKANISQLYACGETACTGVHGANRLASNSLLEAVVFAKRITNKINKNIKRIEMTFECKKEYDNKLVNHDYSKELTTIQNIMREYVGIIRNINGLKKCLSILNNLEIELKNKFSLNQRYFEIINIITTAKLITKQAMKRKESIGTHYIVKENNN